MQIFVIMLILLILFNIWRNFAETKMEIASGLREQFHSHTVSKQEKHHCEVVKFVIVVSFCLFVVWSQQECHKWSESIKSFEMVWQSLDHCFKKHF